MTRGQFISLEGSEGAGKSTQVKALANMVRARGIDVLETREPGGSTGAEAIRTLLLTGEADRWSAPAEALLFAAARADHVQKAILPALDRGSWVLCDRFLDSSRAYQGMSGIDDVDLMALHRFGSGGLLPDRTLLLSLHAEQAADRARRRDGADIDRIGGRDPDYHAAVARAFLGFAEQEPDRFRVIDASGPPDGVTRRLVDALADMLP
ncbi:MAG: dTMP kinase [Sphingobium sp.]